MTTNAYLYILGTSYFDALKSWIHDQFAGCRVVYAALPQQFWDVRRGAIARRT